MEKEGITMKKDEIVSKLDQLKKDGAAIRPFKATESKADLEALLAEHTASVEPPAGACDTFGEHDANSTYCQTCEKEEAAAQAACVDVTAKATADKKAKKRPSGGGRRTIENFDQLKKLVKDDDSDRMTIFIDRKLLRGGIVGNILKATTEENTKRGGMRYRTLSNLYHHINARVKEGWVFEVDGEPHEGSFGKDDWKSESKIKAVDYKRAAVEKAA
jgi:hypothetical protein